MTDPFKELAKPFPPDRISWRVGPVNNKDNPTQGIALAYLDARDVQDRLDQVLGPDKWQSRYPHAGQKTVCEIGVKVGDEWVWKADGAGDTDMEAEKGALSDAFKRAAVKWGIGRYLYDTASPWVAVTKKGRSVVIAEHELPRLQKLLPGSKAESVKPDPAQPEVPYEQRKNAPGISAAKVRMRDVIRELNGISDEPEFTAYLPSIKDFCIEVCTKWNDQWIGPEPNSGLKGQIQVVADQLGIAKQVNSWLTKVELAASVKHAAE